MTVNKIQNFFQIYILITEQLSNESCKFLTDSFIKNKQGTVATMVKKTVHGPQDAREGFSRCGNCKDNEARGKSSSRQAGYTPTHTVPDRATMAVTSTHKMLAEQPSSRASRNRHQHICARTSPPSAREGSHLPHPLTSSRQDLSVDTLTSRSP